jgi:2-octaprenyl-6-methoxyphenol hydroxylase
MQAAEAIVVGGGPAGLTAAIALAGAGVEVALVGKGGTGADHRTTALLASSVTALDMLGVWQRCRDQAAPLRTMRIVDDTARLLRAPEVCFAAGEIGLDAFGHNIENRFLLAALDIRARELPALRLVDDEANKVEIGETRVTVALKSGGELSAPLVIGADGRRSLCRAAAGIASEGRSYPQTALTCNLRHGRPHLDISTEFHTATGPFTLVPLPGQRSSLVFVVGPAEVDALSALADADLAAEIERRSHSILGKIELEPGRGRFPLAVETATRLGTRRMALIGEAAHVLPPIGAQGLNLGLRDAASIAELVVAARREGRDLGEVTAPYDHMRRADVAIRALAIDLLNRSLLSDVLAVQGARGFSLFLLQRIPPLRRAVMREGVAPLASQPRLMRGEAL